MARTSSVIEPHGRGGRWAPSVCRCAENVCIDVDGAAFIGEGVIAVSDVDGGGGGCESLVVSIGAGGGKVQPELG